MSTTHNHALMFAPETAGGTRTVRVSGAGAREVIAHRRGLNVPRPLHDAEAANVGIGERWQVGAVEVTGR
jgi:hypothetical protein